jgi:hypothetical protein
MEDGEVRVEILDAAGKTLAGFSLSEPIRGDDLRHTVTFSDSADVSTLVGRPVRLRFHLKDVELFAFAFRSIQ